MGLVEDLTGFQIGILIESRANYIKYMKKHGDVKALRDRVNDIDLALKEKEDAIKPNNYG